MNDLSPSTLSGKSHQSASRESSPQNSSNITQKNNQKSSKSQQKQKFSRKKHPSQDQSTQNQHKHDQFDEDLLNANDLDSQTKRGSIGFKKIKTEGSEAKDHDLHSQVENDGQIMEEESKEGKILSIDGMLEESKKSKGKPRIFYQHDSAGQKERNSIHRSLQEELCQQDTNMNRAILQADEVKKEAGSLVTFKYLDFKIQDYTILEILGEGGYGLVIKMRKQNDHSDWIFDGVAQNHVVVKLCGKGNPKNEEEKKKAEKDFINETIMLSMAQKAMQHSLQRRFDWGSQSRGNYFQNNYFRTNKYYGVFIKQGLGSLHDFKEYLGANEIELDRQELFFLTWSLLDSYYCLNRVNLCHRDIKPKNIVFDVETFSPELIDFGLASEISKAKGNGGTGGYQIEDFRMKKYIEKEREDHLVSNDYFAIGKTILEIAFPKTTMNKANEIRINLEKLANNQETKILADMLRICIFGRLIRKKNILEEYREKYLSVNYWQLKDGTKKNKLKEIYENFNPDHLHTYRQNFKKKHLHCFQKHTAKKSANSEDNTDENLQKVKKRLVSKELQVQIRGKEEGNLVKTTAENSFYDEEQYIKNNFLKDLEKTMAMKKCHEIICHIEMEDYQPVNPQLYSTLMVVLSLKGFLDFAIDFGKKALELWGLEKLSGVFLTNLTFLARQSNLMKNPNFLQNEYEYAFLYLYDQYKNLWTKDLIRICTCASESQIKKVAWTQERIEREFGLDEKELILADFEMHLEHQESYFLMNYSYIKACQIDKVIDESTREKIKKFVYGVNISEKESMLSLLEISQKESVLLTLMSFCEIFQDTTLNELVDLKKEAQGILWAKKGLTKHELLLFKPTYAMLGFIILYNLNYDLLAKFDFNEWIESEEVKEIKEFNSERSQRRLDQRYRSLRGEQDRKWNRQQFLDSTLLYLKKIYGEIIQIPLLFEIEDENQISCLSILGQKIESLLLPYPAIQGSHSLVLDFNQNLVFVSAVKIRFFLSKYDYLTNIKFFMNFFSVRKRKLLQRLSLEFFDYDENYSRKLFQIINNKFESCKLKELRIKMKDRIPITDQGILPL